MIFKNIKQQMKETISQKKDAVIESLKEDIIGKPKPKERPVIEPVFTYEYMNLNNQNMPRNDDYAIAVFVQISINGMKVGQRAEDYSRTLSYEYKVHDPVKYHKRVSSEGYLEEATPTRFLERLKVEQLKEILSDNNLDTKGKKADLITRIVENVDKEKLNYEPVYVPTEKGLQHLKKYEFIFTLCRYGITWEEYDIFRASKPEYLKPNDIIWQMLQDLYNKDIAKERYGAACNVLVHMGNFLETEEKYSQALLEYLSALYVETSGCLSTNFVGTDLARVTPYLAGLICQLKEYYTPEILKRCLKINALPFHALGNKNFERLVLDILEDNPVDILNYIKGRK